MGKEVWTTPVTTNLRIDQKRRLHFIAELEGCSVSKIAQAAIDCYLRERDRQQLAVAAGEMNRVEL